jgi:hypothetical protein
MACGARTLATIGVFVVIAMLVASLVLTNGVTPGPVGWSPSGAWASFEGMRGGGCGCSGAPAPEPAIPGL